MIHAYKYNGWLYRTVEYPYVLFETEDILCVYLPKNKIQLIKAKESTKDKPQKKFFFSKNKHLMIWFFFKNKWFNAIAIFKTKYVEYYINIASPFLKEEKAVKYIDFDLDIKINEKHEYKVVDKNEYIENSSKWKYPNSIKKKIDESKIEVIKLIEKGWFKNLVKQDELHRLKKYIQEKFHKNEAEILKCIEINQN